MVHIHIVYQTFTTCFWRAQNIVDRDFCVAIFLIAKDWLAQVSTHLWLGIQPYHEAPGDLWVKIVQNALIKIRLGGFSLGNSPELPIGQPNRSKINWYTIFEKSYLSFTRAPNVLRYTKHRASEFQNLSALLSESIPMDPSPTNINFQIPIRVGEKTWRGDLFIDSWESVGEQFWPFCTYWTSN